MFGMVQGAGNEIGEALVTAEGIKAVGFTGSLRGGRALFDLASRRPEPIPVYAEMGSVNPVFVSEAALDRDAAGIAEGFVASMTLGTGQFCTKPGLVFVPEGEPGSRFARLVAEAAERTEGTAMLNSRMRDALAAQVERTSGVAHVERLTGGGPASGPGFLYPATVLATDAETFLGVAELAEEHFGPFALIVRYGSREQMLELADAMQGSLTASLHADPQEAEGLEELVLALRRKAGRLIWNGFPTGVAVAHAMHHGGPWPATTFSEHTSVGSAAIGRFLRPVAFQDYPEELLPPALRDDNPRRILRLVNGEWTRDAARPPRSGAGTR
jgi:NADP-dependent aldehyde dehydrogenase